MSLQSTCGEALVKLLADYGCAVTFGIPGVHTLDLYRGLPGSGIRHVQARHEQGAAFMADGYARVSGKPGLCFIISGPGVTNAATAIGQAYCDSIPVLMISSVTASHSLGKGWGCLHEVTDQQAVMAPLTGLAATAQDPEELPELVAQAFSLFAAARPRPAHIAVPIDVLGAATAGGWSTRVLPAKPRHDPAAIATAADLLAGAARPLVMLGGGVLAGREAAVAIAERLGAAVITSNAGKGIVPDSHPLNLGVSIVQKATQAFVAEADVVLAAGTELSETDSFVERLEIAGKLIRIDIDPRKMNDLYGADIGIVGDAAPALEALAEALGKRDCGQARGRVAAALESVRAANAAALTPVERQHVKLWQALRAVLPPETVVMGDITQLVYSGSFAFAVEAPGRWYYPAGYCTLGCGLPMAIGGKLARPAQPIIVVSGDGGFMFTLQELATAVEEQLSIPIVLWNNDGLGQIRDDMHQRNIAPTGVNSQNPDFTALAAAFGCPGRRPDSLEAFAAAVREALAAKGPTLIEVKQGANWLL